MMSKFRSFLRTTANLVGIRNWKRRPLKQVTVLTECISLTSYLRKAASVPIEQPIWNRANIEELINRMKIRKRKFLVAFGMIAICMFIIAILYLIGILCVLRGDECVASIPNGFYFILFGTLTSFVGLVFWKRRVERFNLKTKLQDYLHPGLTPVQKEILTQEISMLKDERRAVYEVGNYEELRLIDSMFWSAENWFLVLTENEKDRVGIWLDGKPPLGDLVIKYNLCLTSAPMSQILY